LCACAGRPCPTDSRVCILPLPGLPSTFQNLPLGKENVEVAAVEGLMQDYELSLQHILWRIERLHQKKEVVTKRDEGIHRTTYGEMVPRINRLAGAPTKDDGLPEMPDYETLLAAESESYPWPKLSERMAAAMCYTSGTTGNPKGVVYSHRSQFIHTMGVLQGDNLGLTENDVLLPVVPMFHANSWGLPYAAGMAGSKVVFA